MPGRSKALPSVRGCLKSAMVRIVTVRLTRLPASLHRKGVRRSYHGPAMTEEMVGGQHRNAHFHASWVSRSDMIHSLEIAD
jgi:hypothetical protein